VYETAGTFSVKLTIFYDTFVDSVIKSEYIFVHENDEYAQLDFISGSPTAPQCDWSNAMDGDLFGLDGTVLLEGNQPIAIFCIDDSVDRDICGIGLLTDTGIGYEERWIQQFQIYVSASGVSEDNFHLVLDTTKATGAMEEFDIEPSRAKFIKLVVLTPTNGVCQLGEIEVYLQKIQTATPEENIMRLTEFRLSQNHPNPFNPTTTITFQLPEQSVVELCVYNILGEKIKTLVHESKSAGIYEIKWDGTNEYGNVMASGIYLYVIETKNYREVRKMILTK